MTTPATPRQDVVLLTWVSLNHGAAPILTAVHDLKSPYRGHVCRIYLCWRNVPAPEGDRERATVRATKDELHDRLDPICPELIDVAWTTEAAPTDHAAIRPFADATLKRVRDENPDRRIVVHLSPGTPAMHAIWLVLGTTDFVAGPLDLIQTADERGRAAGFAPVQPVQVDLDTWMRRYRRARPRVAPEGDSPLWDLARVRSPRMRNALKTLQEWAPLRVPVLLMGERGTGKTALASFLRTLSPFQKEQPSGWPVVVCGQFRVNQQLARSELFGHARGAFTGATSDRPGLMEVADGDTLFLDEIGDIDRDTQRLLIAAVEGRGFQRLGEAKLRQSRFRLVSATNLPAGDLRSERLDADFYDRIAIFVLHVPPLRDCPEDLPEAWRTVLARATGTAGARPDGWERFLEHRGILDILSRHPLPGNFRDLQKVAFHCLAVVGAGRSEDEVVVAAIRALDEPHSAPVSAAAVENLRDCLPLREGLRERLDETERAWLLAAMESAKQNKSEAARLLGLPRKTFEHRWKTLCCTE